MYPALNSYPLFLTFHEQIDHCLTIPSFVPLIYPHSLKFTLACWLFVFLYSSCLCPFAVPKCNQKCFLHMRFKTNMPPSYSITCMSLIHLILTSLIHHSFIIIRNTSTVPNAKCAYFVFIFGFDFNATLALSIHKFSSQSTFFDFI